MSVSVALAGLGRSGRQHLERLLVSPDYAIRAVSDVPAGESTHGFAVVDWRTLVSRSDVALIFVTVDPALRATRTIDALASGKHVVVELPSALGAADAEAVRARAERSGRSVVVAHPGLWDDDFCLARQVVRSGDCGPVELASLCLWQHFPAPARENLAVLREFGPLFVHQMLDLVAEAPVRVTCRTIGAGGGFSLLVDFADGAVGQLQIHREAFPAVDSGWSVSGTRGGYAHHTRYIGTPESEIIDEPLALAEDPATRFYSELARHVAAEGPNPSPPDRQGTVLEVIDAAIRSIANEATVDVE
jgi:predicted dehydrogenase